jgi:UDP-glucose 4-epimerase
MSLKKNKRCIIYGGGGFIGSHLADALVEKGHNVTIFDKLNFSRNNISHLGKKVKVIEGDFNNEIDIKNSLKNIDYVFHLVSSTLPASSNTNPIYDAETNLVSSLRLLEECAANKIEKIIFVSSGGTVYGDPQYLPVNENHPRHPIVSYAIIKNTIEDYLFMFNKLHGLEYTVFRLANPYGERQNPLVAQGAIAVFLHKIIHNQQIEIWGDGSVIRDYIYIKDAVDAISKAIDVDNKLKIFNVGSGKGYSLKQLLNFMKKFSGKKIKVKYEEGRVIDVPVNILDISLIKKVYNWKPQTSIETGIKNTYNFFVNNN